MNFFKQSHCIVLYICEFILYGITCIKRVGRCGFCNHSDNMGREILLLNFPYNRVTSNDNYADVNRNSANVCEILSSSGNLEIITMA